MYAKQKQPVAVKKVLPSKVVSIVYNLLWLVRTRTDIKWQPSGCGINLTMLAFCRELAIHIIN